MARFSVVLISLLGVAVLVQGKCQNGQISHTVNGGEVCCKPDFNCPVDHEIHFCREGGSKDSCKPCPIGSINKEVTSSLDYPLPTCFTKSRSHEDCPIQTTLPVRDPESCKDMFCRCKSEDCRYGNVCHMCKKRKIPCGENEEMNITGDCVPCKDMMTSPAGCGPCQYNETLWRIQQIQMDSTSDIFGGKSTRKVTNKEVVAVDGQTGYRVATGIPNNVTDAGKQEKGPEEKGGVSTTVVIIIIVALVFSASAVAIILIIKKKIKNGDESSKLVIWYRKLYGGPANNYQGGQQDPEVADMNGDVSHQEDTKATRTLEVKHGEKSVPRVQTLSPQITAFRLTEDVTENGACGGEECADGANMDCLKEGVQPQENVALLNEGEETKEKEK